jgi:hypothetical protein
MRPLLGAALFSIVVKVFFIHLSLLRAKHMGLALIESIAGKAKGLSEDNSHPHVGSNEGNGKGIHGPKDDILLSGSGSGKKVGFLEGLGPKRSLEGVI